MLAEVGADHGRRRSVWRLNLGYWTALGLLLSLRSSLAGIPTTMPLIVSRAVIIFVGFGSCALIWLLLERLRRWRFWQRAVLGGLLTLIAAAAFSIAVNLAPRLIIGWADYDTIDATYVQVVPVGGSHHILRRFALETLEWLPLFLAWGGFALSQLYSYDVSEREHQVRQLQALSYEAQLRAMRYQVDPHFLFNALNSVSAMVLVRRNEVAEAMLLRLGNFFRHTLGIDPTEDIALEREIGLQLEYLKIEQLRFPELRVEVDIPDALRSALVPSFILQPLVENAVKHGIGGEIGINVILRIAADVKDGQLRLEVSDSGSGSGTGAGTGQPSLGMGLRNVRERLAVRFGENSSLNAVSLDTGGFAVTLAIPLHFAPESRTPMAPRPAPDTAGVA